MAGVSYKIDILGKKFSAPNALADACSRLSGAEGSRAIKWRQRKELVLTSNEYYYSMFKIGAFAPEVLSLLQLALAHIQTRDA